MPHSWINVKGSNVNQIADLIRQEIGGNRNTNSFSLSKNLFIDIYDCSRDNKNWDEFMKDENLEEDDPILKQIDTLGFDVSVSIDYSRESLFAGLIGPLTDNIARLISKKLDAETMAFFPYATPPFAIYKKGALVKEFYDANADYLDRQTWVPSSYRNGDC